MRWRVVVALVGLAAVVVPAAAVRAGARPRRAAAVRAEAHPRRAAAVHVRPASAAAVHVRPARGTAATHFVISFRSPDATGVHGSSIRRYAIAAAGPQVSGCDRRAVASAGAARQGALVRVTLVPRAHWCAGAYHGAVDELAMPVCRGHAACPQFVVVLRRVGGFMFSVR